MLARILDRAKYPASKHLLIVDIMRKFELCFDLADYQDRRFLIPDLLPKEELDTGDWSHTLAFQFRYNVLPSSIITRFIVRKNDIVSQKTYWRSGVVLANEGNRALVKADREEKIIYIYIDGPTDSRCNLLSVIRSTFKSIHTTIPGLQVEEIVSIPNHPVATIEYSLLVDLNRQGIIKHYVKGKNGLIEIDVRKLLDGVESPMQRQPISNIPIQSYPPAASSAVITPDSVIFEIKALLKQISQNNPSAGSDILKTILELTIVGDRRQEIARNLRLGWESQVFEVFPDSTQRTVVKTVLQDWCKQIEFDVFLSHNSSDKPTVRQLGQDLQNRNLTVWLDEWELVPGQPWQEALEASISQVKAAAVLVGKDGLGPWQDREMRAFLSEFVNRKVPVIPVLLPGAPSKPELPIFLKQFTWVDLRAGLTKEECDRLQWGITGQKPN